LFLSNWVSCPPLRLRLPALRSFTPFPHLPVQGPTELPLSQSSLTLGYVYAD